MDCSVCCYSSLNINKCGCKFKTCFKCIKKIGQLYCINCNALLTKKIINQIKAETNIYKKHFVLSKLNSYCNILIKDIILNIENRKLLRFGTQIFDTSIIYIFNCIKCSGYVNLEYNCNLCKSKYCQTCEELILENHICDRTVIDSLKTIKQNYKKCPFCFTYIEKIANSCNDMKCVCCGIYFNWNDLLINNNGNSNNHYKNKLLRPDLHNKYIDSIKNKDIINKNKDIIKKDIINKNKVFSLFTNYINPDLEDTKAIQICNNIINKINKHHKKKNLLEYTYFIENKQISDKSIEKLYYSYKSIEYYEIIITKIINFKQRYKFKFPCLLKTKFFKNLIEKMAKMDYPDKVKYYLKNVYINKLKTKNLFNEYFYIPRYKIISNNFNDYGLIKILEKFKFCHHISNYHSKISILNVLVRLKISNILIITNNISIDEWKTIIQDYIFNIIFIPIHKIEQLKKNINIIKLFEKKNPDFINENSILIFENNSQIILNNDTINILYLFTKNFIFNNAYFIFICNGSCLQQKKSCDTYTKLIFYYEDAFKITDVLLSKFSKKEILEITIKNNVFYNKNENYIKKNKVSLDCCSNYFMNTMKKYIIEETNDYIIYRLNYIFYIINKKENFKIITQSHKKCEKFKKCIYCIKCSGLEYMNRYKTSINHSVCCHVHSLSFYNIRPHKIYLIKDKPVFYSVSPNLKMINKKFFIWKNIYQKTAFYLEHMGFSVNEINLMYHNKDFVSTIKNFILENTHSAELYSLDIINHIINFSDEDKKAINYAYKDYDIVKNYIVTFKHLQLKGRMLTEQVYLKYINKYIKDNIYEEDSIHNIKYIIILEFNKNIEDLANLLKDNNIKNILYIFNNINKYKTLDLFKNSDKHNILILNSNILIPKQDLSNFNVYIIFTNKNISKLYLKNDIIYSQNYKYIKLEMNLK